MLTPEQNTLRRNIIKAFIKAADTIYKQRMYMSDLEEIAQTFIGNSCSRVCSGDRPSSIVHDWRFYLDKQYLCSISIVINNQARTVYISHIECRQYSMEFNVNMYFRCTYKPSDTRNPIVPQQRELMCSNGVLSGTKPTVLEYRDRNGTMFAKYYSFRKEQHDTFYMLNRALKAFEYSMRTGEVA